MKVTRISCILTALNDISKQTPIDMLMDIGEKETPKVYFDKVAFKKLVSSAIDKFPSQYNYFLVGEVNEDNIDITDFKPVPIFEYPRPYGTFGHWEFRKCVFDGQENEELDKGFEELEGLDIIGYLHAHSSKQISQSNLFYEYLYSKLLDNADKEQFKVHIQLNNFSPVLKELVMANHNRFDGSKPLTESKGYGDIFTDHFEAYMTGEESVLSRILKKAKTDAKRLIRKNPQNYACAYTTILDMFEQEADDILFKQLDNWLSKDTLDIDAFANLKLTKRIQGKIHRLPFEVRKVA
ncbi:hypothetical protein GQ472_00500 [archaeon]|nr:hypothetical protein [archaeon]